MKRRAAGSARSFAVITGGGTGGHVSPALAIGEALVGRGHLPSTIHFVGARRGIERTLVPEAGFGVSLLPGRGIARRLTLANLGSIAGIAVACAMAIGILARRRPSVVLTVGGYAGFPAALAAVLLRIPLVVVHIDAVPGAANRLVARRAAANAVTFPGTPVPRSTVTGSPVRSQVLEASCDPADRRSTREGFGLDPERALVVVTGGSLGAESVNRAALEWCESSRDRRVSVYHVAGQRNVAQARARAKVAGLRASEGSPPGARPSAGEGLDYRLVGFEGRLPALLAASDVVVARAGASTLAELTSIGVPSVLVPLPGAPGDHQTRNAVALAEAGAAVVLPDRECNGKSLGAALDPLLADATMRDNMAKAARGLGRRDAADRIAEIAEAVARGDQ